jgi:hypothetical protein
MNGKGTYNIEGVKLFNLGQTAPSSRNFGDVQGLFSFVRRTQLQS